MTGWAHAEVASGDRPTTRGSKLLSNQGVMRES